MMTEREWINLQEAFVAVFGPIVPYLLLALVVGMIALIMLMLALALLRRMFNP